MRRADREVTDPAEMEAIIRQACFCTMAMSDDDGPYAVPLSFGFGERRIYFHGANEGLKISLLRRDPRVCLTFVASCETMLHEQPCFGVTFYSSVIIRGRARLVSDADERARGLDIPMAQQGAPGPHTYDPGALEATQVIAVDIDSMTGKRLARK